MLVRLVVFMQSNIEFLMAQESTEKTTIWMSEMK